MPFFPFRTAKEVTGALFLSLLLAGAAGYWFYDEFLSDLPDLRRVEDYRPALTSVVLDRKGRLIAEFHEERRRLVPIGEISETTKLAFVAAEDKSFFEHKGLDYSSIVRAAVANLMGGGIKQGASTITQQTVKSLLLTPERTFRRKIREMVLARRIEDFFTKDEILYLYVNQIYFGHGAWGIGQAARDYFGKPVKDLSISESALLAGLPQRPSDYSPYRNPQSAERRRLYVLGRMFADGFIEEASYNEAVAHPPVIRRHPDEEGLGDAGHFTEFVRRHLFDALGGASVLRGGLIVETTLDLELQRAAVAALQSGLEAHDHRQGYRGPLERVEPEALADEVVRLSEVNADVLLTDALLTDALPTDSLLDNALLDNALRDDPDGANEGVPGPGISPGSRIPWDTPLVGAVIATDPETQTARVRFAPDVEGLVDLKDVKWAREPDPAKRPRSVKTIDKVFKAGDIARFVRLEDRPRDAPGGDLPRLGLFQPPIVEGALLSIENGTGDVLAMVGGYDYRSSEFNRATQAHRQPGSAFKPFIYGAALEKGYTPVSEVVDRPVVYTDPVSGFVWAPRNYGRHFYGPMPLRNALKKSVNNATVHLFRDLGVDFVIDYASRFGIRSPLERDLSLALGSSSMTLLELTTAYSVFPNQGRLIAPRFIRRVSRRNGTVLLEDVLLGDSAKGSAKDELEIAQAGANEPGTPGSEPEGIPSEGPTDRVISEAYAYLMSDLLSAVVQEGTGRGLRRLGRPLAGKTGTTNEQGDAWFMGFSPDLTTGVWVGHDDNRLLGFGETGAGAALPVWRDFMRVALADREIRDFEVPGELIVFERIDRETGLLADSSTQNAYFQPFLEGTEPERSVSEQKSASDSRRALRDDIF
ncbi:MAG: PBP1A family penicillin-binding protein [Myxococcota bacterium]|nr:PBP1A family penicillin-binding protein [Myxococcota bacterium]